MKREITNATAQTHTKKKETEGEKEDCFPKLVIYIIYVSFVPHEWYGIFYLFVSLYELMKIKLYLKK